MKYKRIIIIFLVTSSIIAAFLFYQFLLYPFYIIEEISSNPKSFDGWHVLLRGSIIKNVGAFFGPKYELKDNPAKIALRCVREIDLEPYVSYTFDGHNYTKVSEIRVVVIGYLRYEGLVVDGPSYYLDVEGVNEE